MVMEFVGVKEKNSSSCSILSRNDHRQGVTSIYFNEKGLRQGQGLIRQMTSLLVHTNRGEEFSPCAVQDSNPGHQQCGHQGLHSHQKWGTSRTFSE